MENKVVQGVSLLCFGALDFCLLYRLGCKRNFPDLPRDSINIEVFMFLFVSNVFFDKQSQDTTLKSFEAEASDTTLDRSTCMTVLMRWACALIMLLVQFRASFEKQLVRTVGPCVRQYIESS